MGGRVRVRVRGGVRCGGKCVRTRATHLHDDMAAATTVRMAVARAAATTVVLHTGWGETVRLGWGAMNGRWEMVHMGLGAAAPVEPPPMTARAEVDSPPGCRTPPPRGVGHRPWGSMRFWGVIARPPDHDCGGDRRGGVTLASAVAGLPSHRLARAAFSKISCLIHAHRHECYKRRLTTGMNYAARADQLVDLLLDLLVRRRDESSNGHRGTGVVPWSAPRCVWGLCDQKRGAGAGQDYGG